MVNNLTATQETGVDVCLHFADLKHSWRGNLYHTLGRSSPCKDLLHSLRQTEWMYQEVIAFGGARLLFPYMSLSSMK